ncbi:MAG: two-component system response regulator [Paenibacillaceae bacterium]|jgi:two-component system chemotaxis response regulator CheY|nr:two-component system response regulator [Paenibacillaceae bacterium]
MAKIMIVDDAAFMRRILSDMLSQLGHEVVAEAVNGEEAIVAYSKVKPDIVTMDITMPMMDGITAMKSIRSIDPTAKIVICSALGHHETVIEAIKSGARDFIVKPFVKERVQDTLEKLHAGR